MKAKVFVSVLLCIAWCTANASTYQTYVPRSASRDAATTVLQLSKSESLPEFREELLKNTSLDFDALHRAAKEGRVETKLCGDCRLVTAGLRKGESVYHRRVRSNESVAYLNGIPLFLPACGNPVRPSEDTPAASPKSEPVRFAVVEEVPEIIGCTDGRVQYSSGNWENPGTGGWFYSSGGGGYSWTVSHHVETVCTWESSTTTEGGAE